MERSAFPAGADACRSVGLVIAIACGLGVVPLRPVQATNIPKGDAVRGKELFQTRCIGCHSLDRDDEGPRLRGIYGRTSAATLNFPYSDALKQARIVWNAKSLDKWLAHPQTLVPGSGMPVQVTDPQQRRDLIAYLKANSK